MEHQIFTSRFIKFIDVDGTPCIECNGVVVSVEAFLYLYTGQGIDGLFAAASMAGPIKPTQRRTVMLNDEKRKDFVLEKVEKLEENVHLVRYQTDTERTITIESSRVDFVIIMEAVCANQ